ncbi:hypothetical protein EDB92DRAFT_1888002, partial [Lactarius akahatsu]
RMDILFNGDFCLFLFWLLGSTTDFTPRCRCKFDHALAPQGEITLYNSIACTISPQIYHGSGWHPARSLGSGVEILNTFLFFCYDPISTDPTLPTVFFWGRKGHGKRVI